MVQQHVLLTTVPPSVLHTSIAHVAKPTATDAHVHTQYVIRVSDERAPGLHWTVYRRYSEFRVFRQRLEEAIKRGDMCTHCDIMAKRTAFMQFPHRRLFWNTKESVLEGRRVGLNAFLDAVTRHARTCREGGVACQTRPLMDQFLDVNDMRYTYLNVNMGDQDEDFRGKLSLHSNRSSSGSRSSTWGPMVTPTHASTVKLDTDPHDTDNNQAQHSRDSGAAHRTTTRPSSEDDGRVLSMRQNSLPNLLDYTRPERGSRLSRNSFHEDRDLPLPPSTSSTSSSSSTTGRLSDWESAKYQTTFAGRHSDPGVTRNDLLAFAGCTAAGRRSENRHRPRKVHLSSAAKRVKKLEEQEARFSSRPPQKKKKVTVLETIEE